MNRKYRAETTRLQGWDYGSHGLYFITMCTKDRGNYLCGIKDNSISNSYPIINLTEIGQVAKSYWEEIPKHFPFIELDQFVIMPDHVHGILFINKPDKTDWEPNKMGKQSQNLASVIRGYKASVKKYANLNEIDFQWQSGYYDRIIRDEKEHHNIAQYIYDNPERWLAKTCRDK